MEPEPAHASVGNRARQREQLRHRRQGAVECGVEADGLPERRASRGYRADRRKVVWHVKRIERRKGLQGRYQRGRDQFGRAMVRASVDDAMARGYQPVTAQMGVGEV